MSTTPQCPASSSDNPTERKACALQDAESGLQGAQDATAQKTAEISEMRGAIATHRWAKLCCHKSPANTPHLILGHKIWKGGPQKAEEVNELSSRGQTFYDLKGFLCRVEANAAREEAGRATAEASRLEAGLREVRGKLEQRRTDSNSQKSQSAIGQALMQAKTSGKIPGIYGRLGEH